MWPQLIMAAIAALKAGQDQTKANQQAKFNVMTNRLSPWTHRETKDAPDVDMIGNVAQGYAAGEQMNENMDQSDANKNLKEAQTNRLNSGGSLMFGGKDMTAKTPDTGYLGGDYKFTGLDGGGLNTKMSAPTQKPNSYAAASMGPSSNYGDVHDYSADFTGPMSESDKELDGYLRSHPWSQVNSKYRY